MRTLVTGLHRSGNSVMAHLLSEATGKTLLDDPRWVIEHPVSGLAYRVNPKYYQELCEFDIVKAPRMVESLNNLLVNFPDISIIYMVRDPRDVYASILEKIQAKLPTSMLDNKRFGDCKSDWEGVARSFNYYTNSIMYIERNFQNKIYFVDYENFFLNKQIYIEFLSKQLRFSILNSKLELILDKQYNTDGKSPFDQAIKGPNRWRRDINQAIAQEIYDLTEVATTRLKEHCNQLKYEIKQSFTTLLD